MSQCNACPRRCSVDRSELRGFCGASDKIAVSRIALHEWEEPSISGSHGSGTIFFAGCNLRCVFCQNKVISASPTAFSEARCLSVDELADAMLALQRAGAHNVNLVTPTHFVPQIAEALRKAKARLEIPVVYNSSGYESVDSLRSLSGLVDVYLPDLKYFSSELSGKYSAAPDYFEVAAKAICEMYRQTGEAVFNTETVDKREVELIKRGVIVRHLVLPGCRKDSLRLVEELSYIVPSDGVRLSLMRQFTPDFVDGERYPELKRRLTSFEYESVVKRATELGFDGYTQGADAASAAFTPDFE